VNIWEQTADSEARAYSQRHPPCVARFNSKRHSGYHQQANEPNYDPYEMIEDKAAIQSEEEKNTAIWAERQKTDR